MSIDSFLKFVDTRFMRHLLPLVPACQEKGPLKSIKKVLIIRPGGLGDAILLLPAVFALKNAYKDAEIVVLAERRNYQAFSLLPFSCKVLDYKNPKNLFGLFINPDFDLVIDTEQWYVLPALVARFLRSKLKIGFATNERKRCFSYAVEYRHDEYEVVAFSRLFKPIGLDLSFDEGLSFSLSIDSKKKTKMVAIFPGASDPARRWGRENFLKVAQALVKEGWRIGVIGGEKEKPQGEYIVSNLPAGQGINLTGSLSLIETAKALKDSEFLITADSGIMHLGWLIDVPTLSIFGPGIIEKWAPRGPNHLAIRLELSCSPCTRFGVVPPCPYEYRCMKDLSPEMVIDSVREFIRMIL